VAFLAWPPAGAGPTICPFALVTGLACPLCGGTRAAAALLHGDLAAAWAFHPLVFVVVPVMVVLWFGWLRSSRDPSRAPMLNNRVVVALGAAFLVVWIVRLTAGTLPPV
jgi:hypothetical protein